MKQLDDEARYFSAALLAEMTTARGRGIQTELARLSGISPAFICDLKHGRAESSPEKREALIKALGYQYYEEFIAKGRELENKRLRAGGVFRSSGGEARDDKSRALIRSLRRRLELSRQNASELARKLIATQEKHILSQEENLRLHRENENLRRAGKDVERLSDPIVGDALTAPAAEAK